MSIACALVGCRGRFEEVPDALPNATSDAGPSIDVCGDSDGLAPNAPWPLVHGCRTNAGRSRFLGPTSRVSALGPVPMDAGSTGIVVGAADRAIFSVYSPGTASAFDIVTGRKAWGTPTPGSMPWLAIGAHDDVYVPSDHGIFYCLDAISGEERWRQQIAGALQPPMLALGYVYFGSETYGVWAVDIETHDPKWHYDVPGGGRVAALAFANGTLYFVDTLASMLYALDAVSGDYRFSVPIAGGALGSPVIGIDAVYVATASSGIAAFALDDGALRWQQPASEPVVQPALLANGDLVTSSASGVVMLIDRTNGKTKHVFPIGGTVTTAPVLAADDSVYVTTTGGIVALDPSDGHIAWQSGLSGAVALGDRAMVVIPAAGQFAVIGH